MAVRQPGVARVALLVGALGAGAAAGAQAADKGVPDKPLSADDCVAVALARSARVEGARADVAVIRAQADQIAAIMSPSLSALTFVAPMFHAQGGFGLQGDYKSDLGKWGPYAHGDFQMVFPLATFGRFSAAQKASEARVSVEKEKAREQEHAVRAEVRRLYGLRLYARSMIPNLENGRDVLKKAIDKAEEMFAAQTGEVTVADRMKLAYGAGEIARFLRLAHDGEELATLALKQAMGLPLEASIRLADDLLTVPADLPGKLQELVARARDHRPEAAQIAHGRRATSAWREAEEKAYLPSLFAAAVGRADYSPVRPSTSSAVAYNLYNDWYVGAAAGLKFDLEPAKASARAAEAAAKGRWVEAQAALAETGIPLQVKKAFQELERNRDLTVVAEEQVKSTRKWMTFSAAGYSGGTAEAKDVLEGVGAYLLSKKNYYDHVLGIWQALADLEQFTGADSSR